MFLSKEICFLEMHRTGSTHLTKILPNHFQNGEQKGFHNRAPKKIYESNISFVGSVRNPWDWYVSVWGKGCDAIGITYERLTKKKIYFNNLGLKTKPWMSPWIFFNQFSKPLEQWREVYSDHNNVENFRKWLKLFLLDRKYDDGTSYGISDISKICGQYTYKYLTLFLKNDRKLYDNSIKNLADLHKIDKQYNVLNHVIRSENLEEDYFELLSKFKKEITDTEKIEIKNLKKTNISSRDKNYLKFYDKSSLELVKNMEGLIIEKYNYEIPSI